MSDTILEPEYNTNISPNTGNSYIPIDKTVCFYVVEKHGSSVRYNVQRIQVYRHVDNGKYYISPAYNSYSDSFEVVVFNDEVNEYISVNNKGKDLYTLNIPDESKKIDECASITHLLYQYEGAVLCQNFRLPEVSKQLENVGE